MAEGALYCMRVMGGPRSASAIVLTVWGPGFLLLFGLHVYNRWGFRADHRSVWVPPFLYII